MRHSFPSSYCIYVCVLQVCTDRADEMRGDFFQQVWPCWKKINEISNSWPGSIKGKWIMLCVSPGQHYKNKVLNWCHQIKKIMMYLTQATTNVNVPVKCVFSFHYRIVKENYWFFYCYYMFHNLHALCSFNNSNLLICFVRDFGCLCLNWR